MPYNSNRVERISEEVTKELAMMLRDVKDPRVSQTMLSGKMRSHQRYALVQGFSQRAGRL